MDAPSQPLPAFPFRRQSPFDPPPQYAAARAARAVFPVTLWDGKRAWLVTRHEEVRAVLADDRRFSGAMAHPDFPTVTEARVTVDKNERAFVGMDNPRHDRYRRMFTREFSVRRMMALRAEDRRDREPADRRARWSEAATRGSRRHAGGALSVARDVRSRRLAVRGSSLHHPVRGGAARPNADAGRGACQRRASSPTTFDRLISAQGGETRRRHGEPHHRRASAARAISAATSSPRSAQ